MLIEGDPQDRNFVTSLARGLTLLQALSAHPQGLSNGALAEAAGLPKPTVARLIHTLVKLGYVTQDKSAGVYRSTAKLMALGGQAAPSMNMAALATPELRDIRDTGPNSGVTASLVEIVGARCVFRVVEQSRQENALWLLGGVTAHILDTAVGRAILATTDQVLQDQIIEAVQAVDPKSPEEQKRAFETGKQELKDHGYVTGFGHWRSDINGIAVPVRMPGSFHVYGISTGGPAHLVSQDELREVYAPLLKAAAQRIEAQGLV